MRRRATGRAQSGRGDRRGPPSLAAIITVIALAVLAGAGPGPAAAQALRLGSAAPDISGSPWINGEPLTIDGLRGRVVLVEFWTYG